MAAVNGAATTTPSDPERVGGEVLRVEGVSKRFGSTVALDKATLAIRSGQVHGLVGGNGSGKSTLVKILAGYHVPDSGNASIRGVDVSLPLPAQYQDCVATLHQDLGLVDGLSVLENIGVSTSFGARTRRPISWSSERRRIGELLEWLELDLSLELDVALLAPGERALVALARTMCELRAATADATEDGGMSPLLILDEPTAALSTDEARAIWSLLATITARGGSALLISHHLEEVCTHCDAVTVLRDGCTVATRPASDVTPASLASTMLGVADTTSEAAPSARPGVQRRTALDSGENALEISALYGDRLDGLSLTVRGGEVVGVVGLLGMGQDELPYVVAGARPARAGHVSVGGREIPPGDVQAARAAGIALVPQARLRDGLWAEASGDENLAIVDLGRYVKRGIYRRRLAAAAAARSMERLGVTPADPTLPVTAFSGGNQQKMLLAKWLETRPRALVLHEPTQGVDVRAKDEIRRILRTFAAESGAAICVCSADLEESAAMCDRVAVVRHGRIAGMLDGPGIGSEDIVALAGAESAA